MGAGARLRARFWVEAVAEGLSTALLVLTLLDRTWIETIVGSGPSGAGLDGGDGLLEWLVVVGLAAVALVAGLLARGEWRAWRLGLRRSPLTV